MDQTRKIPPNQTTFHALAPVIQRWAEICKAQAKQEPSSALRWYLMGRADAHQMDAARLREALSPSCLRSPPTNGLVFVRAYEALLQMMHAVTQPDVETPPPSP